MDGLHVIPVLPKSGLQVRLDEAPNNVFCIVFETMHFFEQPNKPNIKYFSISLMQMLKE